ncbi:MAG: PepSY domain-containing protein [Pseudomonadaceae bacterium]|nr:PepSY domain-containing protein [Pseudomonadaceae bacterium]
MKGSALYRAILITAVAALLLSGRAQARDLDQDEALRLRQAGVILALEQLMQPALGRYPGATLLEAELEETQSAGPAGRYIYDIELLTSTGVVRELELDARDGRILQDEEDD